MLMFVACGGTYLGKQGSLLSPTYPNDYPKNAECSYKVKVPIGYKVKLRFQEFQLEQASDGKYFAVITQLTAWILCTLTQKVH